MVSKKSFFTFFAVVLLCLVVVAKGDLVNRYSFTDGDAVAVDSVSGRDGTLEGTAAISGNQLVLDGSGAVNLPSDILDYSYQSVTIEAWFETTSDTDWQRLFDFGGADGTDGGNCIFYTPNSGDSYSRFVIATNGYPSWSTGEDRVDSDEIAIGTPTHVACVYDGDAGEIRLYQDGGLKGTTSTTMELSGVDRMFAYIGDAVYTNDPYFEGTIDEFRIYNSALNDEQVLASYDEGPDADISSTPRARYPYPADEATDVPPYAVLSWLPGQFADTHDVYLGTDYDELDNADSSSPLLVSPAQDANSYDPISLELDQTYYWRIDEANALPDDTVFKGKVWSFTVESFVYTMPEENITATASSYTVGNEPENTISSEGLDANDLHSINPDNMWLTAEGEPGPAWIKYEFDKIYKMHEMLVWNYNGYSILSMYGLNEVAVEHSIDDVNWVRIPDVTVFPQAPGQNGYTSDITVSFGGVAAKYVRIIATSNWSYGMFDQYGLSKVRFMHIPVSAREPNPADEATNVDVDVTLGWRAGRQADEHNVYISTDEQSVIDGTAAVTTVSQMGYKPLSIELGSTCYWRVDEVNNNDDVPIWSGSIWSFTVSDYIVVDDFESYNDIEAGQEGSNLVYTTWVDGYGNHSVNGSTIGYVEAFRPSMESEIVRNGSQSVPLSYDNSIANNSEATADTRGLASGSDWTKGGAAMLALWFYGDPNNAATEQMYVKINGTKVLYDGDMENVAAAIWSPWIIDLASLGINQNNVTTITIGFERTSTTGGSGTVLIDDIRLYKTTPPLIDPVDPGIDNLVHLYTFDDGTANDSVGSADGTLAGDAAISNGLLVLDGDDDWMSMPGNVIALNTYSELSIECRFRSVAGGNTGNHMIAAFGEEGTGANTNYGYKYLFITPATAGNNSRVAIQTRSMDGSPWDEETSVNATVEHDDGLMHHFVCTVDANDIAFYIDGELVGSTELDDGNEIAGIGRDAAYLGKGVYPVDPEWAGSVDRFSIYNKALSEAEVLYLVIH